MLSATFKPVVFAAALVCAPGLARAQEASAADAGDSAEAANRRRPRAVALDEVLGAAVRRNPSFRQVSVAVDARRGRRLSLAGADDWTLSLAGIVERNRPSVEGTSVATRSEFDALSVTAGIRRQFRSGAIFSLDAVSSLFRETYVDLAASERLENEAATAGISATYFHPFLRGAGEDVARAEQRKAELAVDAATLSLTIDGLELVNQVIDAYWELAYATRVLEIREQAVEIAEEQLRITELAARVGTVGRADLLAIRQAIAVKKEAMVQAEIALSERSIELRRIAGLEIGPGEIELRTVEPLEEPDTDVDLDAALEQALAASPELAQLRLERQRAAIDLTVAEDAKSSRLDLTVQMGPTARSGDAPGLVEQLAGVRYPGLSAELRYEKQLGNRTAEGQRREAEALQRDLELEIETLRRELSVSVVRAVNLMRRSQYRIAVSETAVALAEENLEIEKARFEVGKASNFDVLERQAELEQARLGHARAVVDAIKASTMLSRLTGQLLDRYGIEIIAEP